MTINGRSPIIKTIYDNSCGEPPAGREAGTGGAGGLWESNVEDLDIGSVLPVSYTHLDVYKRQIDM